MSDGINSIKVETHLIIDQLSPDKLQRVYEYTKRVMEESPIGNRYLVHAINEVDH